MSHSNPNHPIQHIVGNVFVHVKQLKPSVEWYGKLLNMPVRPVDDDIPFYHFDMDNGTALLLDDNRNNEGREKPICMLKTSDIDAAYRFMRENGVDIVLDMQNPHPGLAYFNIKDPEGNVLMVGFSDWTNPNPLKPLDANHPIKNRIGSVIVPVQNLKRATEWFSRILGQPIKPERQDGGPIYWFDMENGTGILLDDNRNNRDQDVHPTFMLGARDIHRAYQFLRDSGVEMLTDIRFDHYFNIKDPDGNAVMICA